jgi:O-acetyl-ADP-ribose deacetylase (regulator of RNase III)
MITYTEKNIFEIDAQTLVNPVNTMGVMDTGLAKLFRETYPQMFPKYRALCESKKLSIGRLHLYKASNRWILNFPTKKRWKDPSKIEYIEQGLSTFERAVERYGITSVVFPCLGCGFGGLDWSDVRKKVEKRVRNLDIDVFLYENVPDETIIRTDQELVKTIRLSSNGDCESLLIK